MIGFHERPTHDREHLNEDPETRDLDKKKLYNLLATRNFLPPLSTKGITRDYLLKAYRGEVYTIPLYDLKHFEVELTLEQTKRAGMPNNSLLVRKIDGLLRSRGQAQLGFDAYEPPDEVDIVDKNWLYRVARYVDVNNILQFFEAPVDQGRPEQAGNNAVHRTHYGRLKASKFFHRLPEARRDKKLWAQLHSINTAYKGYLCQKLMIEKLEYDTQQATQRRVDLERQLDNLISQAACIYTTIETPNVSAENIIHGDNVSPETRNHIMMNCRL
jgi:hypothetical protein